MWRSLPGIVLFLLTAFALAETTAPPATPIDSAEFARLRTLAGTWMLVDETGKPTASVGSVFEVVAHGHSIRETMFPGTPDEMVNMYYRDGAATGMTHYCAGGNQPHLAVRTTTAPDTLNLEFAGITNLKSPDAEHMHSAKYIWDGNDRLRTEWQSFKDGKPSGTAVFNLVRQPRN